MDRYAWFVEKSNEVVDLLPTASRELLSGFNPLPNEPVVAHATLVSFVCHLYAKGMSPDLIAEHLGRSFFRDLKVVQSTILRKIVLPACERYRTCDLRVASYWDAERNFYDLFSFYLNQRLREVGNIEQQKTELSSLWLLSDDNLKDEVLELASPNPTDADFNLVENPPNDFVGNTISEILDSEGFQTLVEKRLAAHDPELFHRPYLLRFARFMTITDIIRQLPFDDLLSNLIVSRIEQARQNVSEPIMGLSVSETELLIPADPEHLFIRECLAKLPRIMTIDPLGTNALPDEIDGRVDFPLWIQDWVYYGGARFFHQSIGPIPYLFMVVESWVEESIERIGFHEIERSGSDLVFPISLLDSDNQPLQAPFIYNLNSIKHLYDLLLLIMVGRARLDIATFQDSGSLELLRTTWVRVPADILHRLKDIVMTSLRDNIGTDIESITAKFLSEATVDDAGAGFLMCENSKSEQLLIDLKDFTIAEDGVIDEELLKKYHVTKAQLLDARVELAKLLRTKQAGKFHLVQDSIKELKIKLINLRERIRATAPYTAVPQLGYDKLAKLSQVLETEERCFLHLTFRRTALDPYALWAVWCRLRGNDVECGKINLSSFSTKYAWDLTHQYLVMHSIPAKQEKLLEIIEYLGIVIAEPIANELVPRGIKHLIISPVGFLDLLPLHSAPVSAGEDNTRLLCDVFERLTYAPSLSLLEHLSQLGPVKLGSCMAVAYSDKKESIQNIGREGGMLSKLFGETVVLENNNATPNKLFDESLDKSIIHLACHAEHIIEDYYSSGLQLFGKPDSEGWLSAARILAEGNFRSTTLVTLSACNSGRSFSGFQTSQNNSGIDSAFLARGARSTLSTIWEVHDLASFLFMLVFYVGLLKGKHIDKAHSQAINFLRFKQYQELKQKPDLVSVLNAVHPNWEYDIKNCRHDFSHPFFWGTFKCSGLTWGTS